MNWDKAVEALGSTAFSPQTERTDLEADNKHLREELRQLKVKRDTFKN